MNRLLHVSYLNLINFIECIVGAEKLHEERQALQFINDKPDEFDNLLYPRLRSLAMNYPQEVMSFIRQNADAFGDPGVVLMLQEVSCDAMTTTFHRPHERNHAIVRVVRN